MAGARFAFTTDNIATSTSQKTLMLVKAPATQRIKISKWWVEFQGQNASSTQVRVALFGTTYTSGGTTMSTGMRALHTGNPTTPNLVIYDPASTLPTMGTIVEGEVHRWHPTTGVINEEALGGEIEIANAEMWGIRVTAATDVNCAIGIRWEE